MKTEIRILLSNEQDDRVMTSKERFLFDEEYLDKGILFDWPNEVLPRRKDWIGKSIVKSLDPYLCDLSEKFDRLGFDFEFEVHSFEWNISNGEVYPVMWICEQCYKPE